MRKEACREGPRAGRMNLNVAQDDAAAGLWWTRGTKIKANATGSLEGEVGGKAGKLERVVLGIEALSIHGTGANAPSDYTSLPIHPFWGDRPTDRRVPRVRQTLIFSVSS